MQEDLAGARLGSGNLNAVQIDQAHIFGRQVELADQGRRAEHLVGPDAIGDVAAVAIDKLRIHSLRPTAQISFLTASASGVEKSFGLAGLRVACTGLGALLEAAATTAPVPITNSISFCRRKSRAEGVMTQRSQTRTWVAPAASAACASRMTRTF